MPVFITLTEADIDNPTFWAGLDVDENSTIDVSGLSDTINITLTNDSISFENTVTGITTVYQDSDLLAGSFSEFVQFIGNNGANDVSGSVGLNGQGYVGGTGNDTLVDDGALGGQISGGAGDDSIVGGVGSNNIAGGTGNDTLRGGSGNNNLNGGSGDDLLFGEDGSGNLTGGSGDDTIFAGSNTSFVSGGFGTDSLNLSQGSTFTPFFNGSTGGFVTLPNGNTLVYLGIENVDVVCFAKGVSIATSRGDVAVEELRRDELILTRDRGNQPLRWIGSRFVGRDELRREERLRPIRLRVGSLGRGLPRRDLVVSPQHRILVSSPIVSRMFNTSEILIPAKKLTELPGIDRDDSCIPVEYYHLLFDNHEVVYAEGAAAESLYLGPMAVNALTPDALWEIEQLFPEVLRPNHTPLKARYTPAGRATRTMLRRHKKNHQALLASFSRLSDSTKPL